MNEEPRERRQRAVRLTDEALTILQDRLLEHWRKSGNSGRFTRAARAEMLALSVSTADRILNQNGNDKAVLVQAFERVGLEWDDAYCESRPNGHGAETNTTEDQIRVPVSARNLRWMITATFAFVALAVLGFAILSSRRSEPIVPDPAAIVEEHIVAARRALDRADFSGAERSALAALRLAKQYRQAGNIAYGLQLEGGALAAQGRLHEAAACYKEALPFWTTLENPHERASLLDSLGVTEARLGHLENAQKHFAEAIKICRKVNDAGVTAGVLRGLGSVNAVNRHFPEAINWYDTAIILLKDRPAEPMHVDLKALRALVFRDQGAHERALRDLQECLSYWKNRGERRWMATTLFQIASVHIASGNREQGEQKVRAAKKLFEEVGDKRGVEECLKLLAAKDPRESDLVRRIEEYF